MNIFQVDAIFFAIIFIIGGLTIFSDLNERKIYNKHLLFGSILALSASLIVVFYFSENITPKIFNGLIATITGFFLYRFRIWRGGDAKLFALYAFLMPLTNSQMATHEYVLNLFICAFIAGSAILFPVFVKDIITNFGTIIQALRFPERGLLPALLRVFLLNWILMPFYYLINLQNPVIILAVSHIIFLWGYEKFGAESDYFFKFLRNKSIPIVICLSLGVFVRIWLIPNFLNLSLLIHSISIILLSLTVSTFVHTSLKCLKEYEKRVPFAPLLFMGCLLNYTPFLLWIANILK